MKREWIESLKNNTRLDVRLPDQLKDEFLARCRAEGVSSGAVIRSLIIDYLKSPPTQVATWLRQIKETIVKRSKWIAGLTGGAAAAGLAAMSVLFAPMASAEEVRVDYQLRVSVDGELQSFSGMAEMGLGDGLIDAPVNADGEVVVRIVILPRACDAAALSLDPACEVAFQLHVFQVSGEELGTLLASFNLFGQVGEAMNFANFNNDGAPTLALQIRAHPV